MKVTRLIRVFDFQEDQRRLLVLGYGTRLNPETHRLQLKESADGAYGVDTIRECRTQLFHPNTSRGWVTVETAVQQGYGEDGTVATWVGYRVANADGDVFWWNGSEWVDPATEEGAAWNTIEELSANVKDFPFGDGLRVVVGMSTSFKHATPQVCGLKVCWKSAADFFEEILIRSWVPALRDALRPVADFAVVMAELSDEVSLAGVVTPYDIQDIDSAYDETDDPEHESDILSAWDPGTKEVTLSGEVPAGHLVRVRFSYRPVVAVTTSQDFLELAAYPAVVIDDARMVNAFSRAQVETIVNRGTGGAVEVGAPVQGDMDITLLAIADKLVDQARLATELERALDTMRKLHSPGLDESWPVTVQGRYTTQLVASKEELYRGGCTARVHNLTIYLSGDRDLYAVRRLHLQGMMNVTIEGG